VTQITSQGPRRATKGPMKELRYKHVEAALVRYFDVPEQQIGAFRARVRYLRKIGVPDLAKVGSGTQLTYSREQAIEMMLALQVSQLGASPKWFASTKQSQPDFLEKISAHPKRGDTFSIIVPNKLLSTDKDGSRVTVLTVNGKEGLTRWLEKTSVHSYSVINLSQTIRELDQQLAKTV
jgi:hypothetical protein